MRRRDFITLLGAAAACPLAARAQQRAVPLIGLINVGTPEGYARMVAAFHQGLSELGYKVGDNAAIEYRWARGEYDRLPAMAAELVRLNANVIVGNSTAALATKRLTTTIPIVFSAPGDPIASGLVASLNRPGGNVTGISSLASELGAKRLQLLHELVPAATTMAALVDPGINNFESQSRDLTEAATALGLHLHILQARGESDFEPAFATATRLRAGGLVIAAGAVFNAWAERLATLAARYAMPAIYQYREFAAAGALMSYGGSITDQYRLVGVYTGRILKGEKPADLPVQQTTKLELIINLNTAKALGLTVPYALQLLADEVIE
jgi:putative ABC transport system substrate-binding protein